MDVASLYSVAPDYIAQSYGQNRGYRLRQMKPAVSVLFWIRH